jgi:hypothetical protein
VTVALFLADTGRTVDPRKWCDFLLDQGELDSFEGLF